MTDTLQSAFPLPTGCTSTRYVDDAREVVSYDASARTFTVTYDWLENGAPQTFAASPIPEADLRTVPRLELLVSKRYREMREFRAARG